MNRRSGITVLKQILRGLRGDPQWRRWTDSRRFRELEKALEERRPGLL
jgi:hypothetical protein